MQSTTAFITSRFAKTFNPGHNSTHGGNNQHYNNNQHSNHPSSDGILPSPNEPFHFFSLHDRSSQSTHPIYQICNKVKRNS